MNNYSSTTQSAPSSPSSSRECQTRAFKSPRQQNALAKKGKRHTIPPQLRLKVWETYIGKSINGACFVCERTFITFGINVEYGHVIAVARGGIDTIENLRPICGSCNKSMGTENLLEYKARLVRSGIVRQDDTADIVAAARTLADIIGETLRETFSNDEIRPDKLSQGAIVILNNLQILQDAQIKAIARILGISERGARSHAAQRLRVLIATKSYVLPRRLSFSGCASTNRDDVREIIAELDETLLASIFGEPAPDSSLTQLRQHAFKMLGMTVNDRSISPS